MFNKEYYSEIKKELETEFTLLKLRGYDKLRALIIETDQDFQRLQAKYQDIIEREAENQKEATQNEPEVKKEVKLAKIK